MNYIKLFCSISFLLVFNFCYAQNHFKGYENLFTIPANYVVPYASKAPTIDGDINDEVWLNTPWSDRFQDIEGDAKPKPYYDTRVKMLWDESYLYIAAELKDPHVWATLTKRDEIVFFDNDFEVFIDPLNTAHNYFEIEVNAYNNIFDLFMHKPYRSGGAALFSWDTQGMQHAVKVQGTINNPNDTDTGWTVEMAIPFRALTLGNAVNIPKDKDVWRINFSRVQWETDIVNGKYVKRKDSAGKVLPENNWVWSPQGVIDMHRPERWGYLFFSKNKAGENQTQFVLPYTEKQKQYLWLVYYKQQDYRRAHQRYATNFAELKMDKPEFDIDNKRNKLELSSTGRRFEVSIKDTSGKKIYLNEEGLITK